MCLSPLTTEHFDSLALWADISNVTQCLVNNSEAVVAWGTVLVLFSVVMTRRLRR